MNSLYWIIMLIANFILIMFAFRLWGKPGLLIWIPVSVIVANIQVTKTVEIAGLEATLGNIVYATGFLATDMLNEFYGKKIANKAVGMGFFSLVAMTVLMQLALLFVPSEADIVNDSLKTIFNLMPRISAGSLLAYVASNYHDVWAFNFWKKRTKALWIRNNLSTFVSQLIDTVIFTLIAFWGVFTKEVLLQIMLTTLVLKWIVALCDTPMIYLARQWVQNKKISDLCE